MWKKFTPMYFKSMVRFTNIMLFKISEKKFIDFIHGGAHLFNMNDHDKWPSFIRYGKIYPNIKSHLFYPQLGLTYLNSEPFVIKITPLDEMTKFSMQCVICPMWDWSYIYLNKMWLKTCVLYNLMEDIVYFVYFVSRVSCKGKNNWWFVK